MVRILAILFAILFTSSALAVDYPIVYVQSTEHNMPDVTWPWKTGPSKLMIRNPDGTKEVLFAPAGSNGAVLDPKPDFTGEWVYFSLIEDCKQHVNTFFRPPTSGADIYKINVTTREIVRLTETDAGKRASRENNVGVFNFGPCPVGDGSRLVYTSDHDAIRRNQLWIMDNDGKNKEKVGFLNLQSALNPEVLMDGRIVWSTQEGQGHRRGLLWGLWTSYPDGRQWEPFFSAFLDPDAMAWHWQAQRSNGDIAGVSYYHGSNFGAGRLSAAPVNPPAGWLGGASFSAPSVPTYFKEAYSLYQRAGFYHITPWTGGGDRAAPRRGDGTFIGKVTHPAAAPNNGLLVTYSSGPVNNLNRPTNQPLPDFGIYLITGKTTGSPEDMDLVFDEAGVHEYQARALIPYRDIYGIDHPKIIPHLEQESHPSLKPGEPFGLIGSSSVYARESKPLRRDAAGVIIYDMRVQGGDAGAFEDDEIHSLRILAMEMPRNIDRKAAYTTKINHNERLHVMGEIPLRKYDTAGDPILDSNGDPDTSFLAKIPADIPFTFQLLDRDGAALTTAQTWHQVRPGEVRHDCRGCHAHSRPGIQFEGTAASLSGYEVPDLTAPPKKYHESDISAIFAKYQCNSCHQTATPLDPNAPSIPDWKALAIPYRSRVSKLRGMLKTGKMPPGDTKLTPEELKTVLSWIDTGMASGNLSAFLADETEPTVYVEPVKPGDESVNLSAYDFSGINSVEMIHNGNPLTLTQSGLHWSAPATISKGDTLSIKVVDGKTQVRRREITVKEAGDDTPPPPPPPPPVDDCAAEKAELQKRIDELEQALAALRAKIEAAQAALK